MPTRPAPTANKSRATITRLVVLILTVVACIAGSRTNADEARSRADVLLAEAAPDAPAPNATSTAPQKPSSRGPMADVEGRISELHKQLQITPAEEPQFNAYADVMRQNAQAMQELFAQRAQNTDRSAIGQLRWYAKLSAAHAEAVGKLVGPFDALYQSMSDQQKKMADAVFAQLRQRRPPHHSG
jgi:periplasmic protein CpxP/Spy